MHLSDNMGKTKLVLLLLPVIWLVSGSVGIGQFKEAGVEKLKVPVEAPEFNLSALGNGTFGLHDLKGKVALLTFVQDRCSVCKKDASSLDKLARDTKDKNLLFLIVAIQWRKEKLVKFKKEFNISSPILIDESGSVSKAYNIAGYPETFFINRKGKIVGRAFAKEKWNTADMRNLLQHLLSEDR